MGKFTIGLLAFAAGALVGGLFVKQYVEQHAGEIVTDKIAQGLGLGQTGTAILMGIGSTVDQVRA